MNMGAMEPTPQPGETPRQISLASLTVSNSIWNASAFVTSLLVKFITTPLYIHRLGESSYGLLILVISILNPLGLLDFGIGPATIKYVAESEGVHNRRQSINYIRSTLLFNLLVGITGALVIAASAKLLTQSVFKIRAADQLVAQASLYWVGLRWLAMQVSNTFSGIPIALRRYKFYSIGSILASTSVDVSGLIVLYAGGNVAAITQAQVVAACAILVMWILISHHLLPGIYLWPHWHPDSFSRSWRFGFWQTISSLGTLFAHEAERALLGILTSTAAVGLYNVVLNLYVAVYSLSYALGQVLFPTFSHLDGLGEQERSSRIMIQATWSLGILSAGLYVPLFVFARDLLTLWVGSEIAQPTFGVLRVLALAGVVASLFIVTNFYLMGIGKTRWLAWEALIQGAITLGVSLVLIPSLGLNGAAWGILASTLAHLTFIYLTWTCFLRDWVQGRTFFSMLLGQLGMTLALGPGLAAVRQALTWTPTWATLIGAYILCAGLTMGSIVLLDSVLPGGDLRRQEARQTMVRLIPQLGHFS